MQIQGNKYSFSMDESQMKLMRAFMDEQVHALPSHISKLLISEYAEKRILPAGSPRPGPWDNSITPYTVETMDNMSPSSPVQREIILKAAQGGWTALAENILCYYMDEYPTDVLFLSAGDSVLERWATRRLEPAIDSFNMRHKLVLAHNAGNSSRRSADKTFSKDYYGGRLDMASARSSGKMSATDKRVLIRDEVDRVPSQLATGEGFWMDVSWARTNSWSDRRKVMDFGTPTTYEKSEMWKAYLLGDQRKFMVPCPMCGTFQVLEFGSEKSQHGVKPVYEGGTLVSAVYMCEHCHDAIRNPQKAKMMQQGYWEPTTRTTEKFWVSRHWNSCYSPFMPWREMYMMYTKAKEERDGMRAFVNLFEGLPYKEQGTRLSATRIISLRSTYKSGHIPEGVLFTTVGVDIQQGSESDPNNPPRIELEVCGHGKNYRTWSIKYIRIEDSVTDAHSGAWQVLFKLIENGELNFENNGGVEFKPVRIFIDSGWLSHVVYSFVQRVRGAFAVKGEGNNYKPDNTKDARKNNSDRRYKISKNVNETKLYLIATNEYKRILRSALMKQRSIRGKEQPASFCEFPEDYDAKYFAMLNAEEMLSDGSFESGGRRNEATDCRVYNLCAAEVYLNDNVGVIRAVYRKKGYNERETLNLTKEHVLVKLEKDIDNRAKRLVG